MALFGVEPKKNRTADFGAFNKTNLLCRPLDETRKERFAGIYPVPVAEGPVEPAERQGRELIVKSMVRKPADVF